MKKIILWGQNIQQLVQADNKENNEIHIIGSLWQETTVDRWIPLTKGK